MMNVDADLCQINMAYAWCLILSFTLVLVKPTGTMAVRGGGGKNMIYVGCLILLFALVLADLWRRRRTFFWWALRRVNRRVNVLWAEWERLGGVESTPAENEAGRKKLIWWTRLERRLNKEVLGK